MTTLITLAVWVVLVFAALAAIALIMDAGLKGWLARAEIRERMENEE